MCFVSILVSDSCRTVGGDSPNAPCVFPFVFADTVHKACTRDLDPENRPWCSTRVDEYGNHVESNPGEWGYCAPECPHEP